MSINPRVLGFIGARSTVLVESGSKRVRFDGDV